MGSEGKHVMRHILGRQVHEAGLEIRGLGRTLYLSFPTIDKRFSWIGELRAAFEKARNETKKSVTVVGDSGPSEEQKRIRQKLERYKKKFGKRGCWLGPNQDVGKGKGGRIRRRLYTKSPL